MVMQSKNKTSVMFNENYPRLDHLANEATNQLYDKIYLNLNGQHITNQEDIKQSVSSYFDDLFPLLYELSFLSTSKSKPSVVTPKFNECLQRAQHDLRIFGDVPQEISHQLQSSLDSAKILLQAITLGLEVVNKTSNFDLNPICHEALVKLTYCSHCKGLVSAKPCSGFCLNVIRGCAAQLSELDKPWIDFVQSVERLATGMIGSYNLENVLASLDIKISNAIMYAIENGPALSKLFKFACGRNKRIERSPIDMQLDKSSSSNDNRLTLSSPNASEDEANVFPSGGPLSPFYAINGTFFRVNSTQLNQNSTIKERQSRIDLPNSTESLRSNRELFPPHGRSSSSLFIQLQSFVHRLSESKGFFTNLADSMCQDESLATRAEIGCWNGIEVGEYPKTIAGIGLNNQKFNPELNISTEREPNIVTLSTKLERMSEVMNSIVLSPEKLVSDSFVMDEGSGSGSWKYNHITDDEDYDDGSGDGSGDSDGERHVGGQHIPKIISVHSKTDSDIVFTDTRNNNHVPDEPVKVKGEGGFAAPRRASCGLIVLASLIIITINHGSINLLRDLINLQR